MIIGIPREIKHGEGRVALIPDAVAELTAHGHEVRVEAGAGLEAGFSDDAYKHAAALLVTVDEAWAADIVCKVKEPADSEYARLREGMTLFTYLHLAADRALTLALLESGVTSIAYETVTDARGRLPLLAPMSEIAGRLAPFAGASLLHRHTGGPGRFIAGATGVPGAHVVVIGGGVVGSNAARLALGMCARVTLLERSRERMLHLEDTLGKAVECVFSTRDSVLRAIQSADVVIGAVLVPGSRSPQLLSREDLQYLPEGAVLVDVAIDQGGCFETSKPTTYGAPTFRVDEVTHYCVANMPGTVPYTSTRALSNVTLPYLAAMARNGVINSLRDMPGLAAGLSTYNGELTCRPVAEALGLEYSKVAV